MRLFGHCPHCKNRYSDDRRCTVHHVMPLRFYHNSFICINLCEKCHQELERMIPEKKLMHLNFYFDVVNRFLGYRAVTIPEHLDERAHI